MQGTTTDTSTLLLTDEQPPLLHRLLVMQQAKCINLRLQGEGKRGKQLEARNKSPKEVLKAQACHQLLQILYELPLTPHYNSPCLTANLFCRNPCP